MSKEKTAPKTVSELLKPYESLLDELPDEKPLKAKLIETPLGQMFAVSNEKSMIFLDFIENRHFDRNIKFFIKVHPMAIIEEDVKPLKTIESELNEYFDGKLESFETPYDIDVAGTDFQKQVWDEINKVEYGETTTFAELAKGIGKPGGAQPVANACSRNPISLVIPSHRVFSVGKAKDASNSCRIRGEWLLNHEKKFAKK